MGGEAASARPTGAAVLIAADPIDAIVAGAIGAGGAGLAIVQMAGTLTITGIATTVIGWIGIIPIADR